MPNNLPARNVALEVNDTAWTRVARSTVGFTDISGSEPRCMGSGTLLRFGDVGGILTAAHVLEAVMARAEFGLLSFPIRPTQIQRLRVQTNTVDPLIIGEEPWSRSGPDLAFLRLPIITLSALEASATIANGDFHRSNIAVGVPNDTTAINIVCGVVDEFTRPAITEGRIVTTAMEAVMNIGNVFREDGDGPMDRWRMQPRGDENFTPPTSYRGTSGGGFWQILLAPN